MLYRYGQKIFEKIKSAMKPEFEDETPINPFDMWEGANFKIKVKTVKEASGQSYPNYDDSTFDSPSALMDDDDDLEKIWKQCYSLKDLISADKFKDYGELKSRLDIVLGTNNNNASTAQQEEAINESINDNENIMDELEKSYSRSKSNDVDDDVDDDFEDSLARFKELAE